MKTLASLLTVLLFVASGCSTNEENTTGTLGGIADADEVAYAAVDALSGAANTSGAYLAWSTPRKKPILEGFLENSAWAAGCGSAGATTLGSCTNSGGGSSSRVRQFNSCTIGSMTATGTATLTYSTANCSTPSGDGSISRIPALLFTGRRGANLAVTATSHTDYRGTTIAGGQSMTYVDAGGGNQTKTYSVAGLHRVLTSSTGAVLADLSFRSLSPINVTGSTLSDLMLDGGKIEVAHNLKKYVASWVPSSLRWQAGCTCPTSGTLTASLSGAFSGTLKVEFTACGSANLTRDNDRITLTFDSCGSSS